MFEYKTNIDSSKQVFDPTQGQRRLQQQPAVQFRAPAANQHFQDVYRAQGQKAAVDLGRAATENQNQYAMTAQRAQNQSVLSGLNLMAEQQANQYQQQAQADRLRYQFLEDIMGRATGVLGGLL
jgi:hypothetical protein